MGSTEPYIVEQSIRENQPIPDRIINAPQLTHGLELFFNAYLELDTDRSHAMGLTAIPWSSIAKYCEFYKFDLDTCELMFYFVFGLDRAYLVYLKKQEK